MAMSFDRPDDEKRDRSDEKLTMEQRAQRDMGSNVDRGADFARGERTDEAEVDRQGSDFARGERKEPREKEGPDFARGQRTDPSRSDVEGPDFARGQEEIPDSGEEIPGT
jgi:hypothetical protein